MASETRIIKLGDQDWKVTPFHCVVGPIAPQHWERLTDAWIEQLPSSGVARLQSGDAFIYPTEWKAIVARRRREDLDGWVIHYSADPLIVNEYQLEEITLACIDDGRLIVTNFADLPGAADAAKIYLPGEFWLNYCEGGAEKALREGRARERANS